MKLYRLLVLLGLLLFPALAFPGPPPGHPLPLTEGRAPLIDVRDEHLSVKLDGVSWAVVLEELQRRTGLTFRVQGVLEGTATDTFETLPMEKGLRRLFRNAHLNFLYVKVKEGQSAGNRLAQVWILPKGERSSTPTAPIPRPLPAGQEVLVPLIKDALDAEKGEERDKAVGALAEYRDARIRETLIQALRDPYVRVRESAAEALADFKDEATVDELSRTLVDDPSPDVRENAADALGNIASPRAIAALRKALEDESADVRESATRALARTGGERAIEALQRALEDKEEDVRDVAREAIQELTGQKAKD